MRFCDVVGTVSGMRYRYQQNSGARCQEEAAGPCVCKCNFSAGHNVLSMTDLILPVDQPQLNQLALKYGNACNGVLRAAACSYQEQVMRRDCLTGKRLFPFRN